MKINKEKRENLLSVTAIKLLTDAQGLLTSSDLNSNQKRKLQENAFR